MPEFDHLILAVFALDDAADRVRRNHGWGALPAGRHPGGTVNRIVPVGGQQYLELVAVQEQASPAAAYVVQRLHDGRPWCGWALRTDDVEGDAERLGLTLSEGSIENADGTTARWRYAGADLIPSSSGALPFLVDYGTDRSALWRERYVAADHDRGRAPVGVAWLEVGTESGAVPAWLQGLDVELRVVASPSPGIVSVGIRTRSGVIVVPGA